MSKARIKAKPKMEPTRKAPTRLEHPAQALGKAYGLLADQPVSLAGLSPEERGKVVISAVLNADGTTRVLSRANDPVWELWPYVHTPNTQPNKTRLCWSGIPEPYREACQNVLYRYWKIGRPGWQAPGVAMLRRTLNHFQVICRYFSKLRIASLADVQPLHVANFIHAEKTAEYAKNTLAHRFSTLELLYLFRDQHPETLQFNPWPESSACEMAGLVGQGLKDVRKTGKTPLIPVDVAQKLFCYAEGILQGADIILDERDAGQRSAYKSPEVLAIRNACFYLLGVLTGMRSSELSSIEVGAGRTEIKNGIEFHWVKSFEHKTKKGRVDYLMPSMGHDILRILERWSEPYRRRLAEQIEALQDDSVSLSAKQMQKLSLAEDNRNRLFLGIGSAGFVPVSDTGWSRICREFAASAGVDWKLAPHQMRRLYAYTFVRHHLGDLLFLKEQFKHSSIDWTQLYASNPNQDPALYDDILTELVFYKAKIINSWMQKDEPLAGKGGEKIMAMRAQDFPNRKALIEETSHRVRLRSTGSGLCLCQEDDAVDCNGGCMYKPDRCADCENRIVDKRYIPIWQEAYRHLRELLKDAEKLGPGAVRRVKTDLELARRTLKELGVEIDEEESDVKITSV